MFQRARIELLVCQKMNHAVQCSTPVQLVDEAKRVARSRNILPVGYPMKWNSSLAFDFDGNSEGLVGIVRLAIFRVFDWGSRSETMTSAGGVTTDIGLSEIDATVGEHASVRQAVPSRITAESLTVGMPPR